MESEFYLPSEIARLVLGYLKDGGCEKAYKAFLAESPHLKEYVSLLKRGRQYPTTINGKSLEDMVHMFGHLHAKDLIETLQKRIEDDNQSSNSMGSKNIGCDDLSDAPSSSVGAPKFNLSSDSDNPSTPTDTEDSGVASTTHSTVPRTSPNDWGINSFASAKSSRIPRPKPKGKLVKRNSKSALKRSSVSPVKSNALVKASTSSAGTRLNQHRTVPKRTKEHNRLLHTREYKSIVPQEISSILPCNDESVDIASPMLSSTRKSFVQSRSMSIMNDDRQVHLQQPKSNSLSLRNLLTAPQYSVTSTPRVNTSSSAPKQEFLTITITSPSHSKKPAASTARSRKTQPTCTVTSEPSAPTHPPEDEEAMDTSSQISDGDALEMRSFGFKTPLKRNVDSPANSIGIGKSPRRKSAAPRRRSQGTDVLLVPGAQPKLPASVSASTTVPSTSQLAGVSAMRPSSVTSIGASNAQNPDAPIIPAIPTVDELVSNQNLMEKLAETINKHVRFDLGRTTPSGEKLSENKPSAAETDPQVSPNQDSLDAILDLGQNIDEALAEIVDHTKNEPAFDSLFKMFNVDKYKFIEEQYGDSAQPSTSASGLVTPPCPVVTDVPTSTSNTEPCSFGNTPPARSSLVQPTATYTSNSTASVVASKPSGKSLVPLPQPIPSVTQITSGTASVPPSSQHQPVAQVSGLARQQGLIQLQSRKQTTVNSASESSTVNVLPSGGQQITLPLSALQLTQPTTQNSLPLPQQAMQTSLHLSAHPTIQIPLTFFPVAKLPSSSKTNDPSKIKRSGDKPSNESLGSLTVVSEASAAKSLPALESMPVLHIEDCDPNSEDVLMGHVQTTSLIHPSSSGSSPGKIETVRIVSCEMPKGCQQLINESPSARKGTNKDQAKVQEDIDLDLERQLVEARKTAQPSGAQSPKRRRRVRNNSSSSSQSVLSAQSTDKLNNENTGYISDSLDGISVCSTDGRPGSPVIGPRTRSRTRSKTVAGSRDTSLESNRSTSSRCDEKVKPAPKQKSKKSEPVIEKDSVVSHEESTKSTNNRRRSTSKERSKAKTSSKAKTKGNDNDMSDLEATVETMKPSKGKKSKENKSSKRKNVEAQREVVQNVDIVDIVERDLFMPEVDLSTLAPKSSSNNKCNNTVDTTVEVHDTGSTVDGPQQKTIFHTGDDSTDVHSPDTAESEETFITPNEYNKSMGLNSSDPDKKSDNTEQVKSEESKQVNSVKKSGKVDKKGEEKKPQKKITRRKLKKEVGPLTIAAKKPDYVKPSEKDVEAGSSNLNFKRVPTYIAPTPSPASSLTCSSASMTPKHVRMLDFGIALTPPVHPGQSPPISSVGAQVTLGIRSPVYAQLGTPGSVHSYGGTTPSGSECGGFMSPAYHQPSPATSGGQTPVPPTNPIQDPVPSYLADHVFGNLGDNVGNTGESVDLNQTLVAMDTESNETSSKPNFGAEESSEASRFAAKLSNVESPNMIRALAKTIGIPTDDSMSSAQGAFNSRIVIQSPPELPNFGREQIEKQNASNDTNNVAMCSQSAVDKEAAEALLSMAHTPVKCNPSMAANHGAKVASAPPTAETSDTSQAQGSDTNAQSTAPDGAQSEDSNSSSVASSVLMPPPTMTPRRNVYRTPKKQMIRTAGCMSPAQSPGMRGLMEATFLSELSQSPRTSRKNLDMMDDLIDSSYSESNSSFGESPTFKLNRTPQKFTTPVKENLIKFQLIDTPSKSLDVFVSGLPTPKKDDRISSVVEEHRASDQPLITEGGFSSVGRAISVSGNSIVTPEAQMSQPLLSPGTMQEACKNIALESSTSVACAHQSNTTVKQHNTVTNNMPSATVSQLQTPIAQTSAAVHIQQGSGNGSGGSSGKKKKKKSKDKGKDKEKKDKRRSKSKKKDKDRDKDKDSQDGAEKSHSGKKKHKRSKSKRKRTEEQLKLEAQKHMVQTPLGSRSPLVCGMTMSQFDMPFNSSSQSSNASGDIALLMSQCQTSPSPVKFQGAAFSAHSSPITSGFRGAAVGNNNTQTPRTENPVPSFGSTVQSSHVAKETTSTAQLSHAEAGVSQQQSVDTIKQPETTGKSVGEGCTAREQAQKLESRADSRNTKTELPKPVFVDECSMPCFNQEEIGEKNNSHGIAQSTVECATSNQTESYRQAPPIVQKEVTSGAFAQVAPSERKPLAEKTTAVEKDRKVKRGKKRHRHKEDKEDTTPEKKKQRTESRRSSQKSVVEVDLANVDIDMFLDAAHSGQIS